MRISSRNRLAAAGLAFVLGLASAFALSCLRFGFDPLGGEDAGSVDAGEDGDGWVGWDFALFEATTDTTGDGRVEFLVGLGEAPSVLAWQPWKDLAGVRALGRMPGQYLGLKARLISPDSLSRAELGGIRVTGSGGEEEWLTLPNPGFGFRGAAHRAVSFDTSRLEARGQGVVLVESPLDPATPLPSDAFSGPGLDDRLWSDRTNANVQPHIGGGEAVLTSTLSTHAWRNWYTEAEPSFLLATYRIAGDFEVLVRHEALEWAPVDDEAVVFAGLEASTEAKSCSIVRRRDQTRAEVLFRGGNSTPAPDPGGELVLRLERTQGGLVGSWRRPADTDWNNAGDCHLSDPLRPVLVVGGRSGREGERVSSAFRDFRVASAGAILGLDASRPEIIFETANALAPHVDVEPTTGAYDAPLVVFIASRAPGSRILYTLDGSDPRDSPSALESEGTLQLSASASLAVRALAASGAWGPAVIRRYFVGEPMAHWPLDDTDEVVRETIHGWDGSRNGVYSVPDGFAGAAAHFDGISSHAVLPDPSIFGASVEQQVDRGALSLWLRPQRLTGVVLSKDARGYGTGGHLSLWLEDGTIRVRLQSAIADYELRSTAARVRVDAWQQITLGFGAPGFTVLLSDADGRLRGGWVHPYTGGLGPSTGGAGNREPLGLGVSTWISEEGSHLPLAGGHFAGDLDELRLRKTPRTTIEPCDSETADPGTACDDGAIFAGEHNGHRLYVAPTDAGRFVYGQSPHELIPDAQDYDDGWSNTNAILRAPGGASKYPAAAACRALGEQWYLPAELELKNVVYPARTLLSLAGTFATGGTGECYQGNTSCYWASNNMSNGNGAAVWMFDNNSGHANSKHIVHNVRCVRR